MIALRIGGGHNEYGRKNGCWKKNQQIDVAESSLWIEWQQQQNYTKTRPICVHS